MTITWLGQYCTSHSSSLEKVILASVNNLICIFEVTLNEITKMFLFWAFYFLIHLGQILVVERNLNLKWLIYNGD